MVASLEHAAGAVVFCTTKKGREYLLLLHHDVHNSHVGRKNAEYWNFPKGRMEEGETDEDTMHRELAEETGITRIRLIPGFRTMQRYMVERSGKRKQKSAVFFLAETKQKQVRISPEHRAYEWLAYDEARKRLIYPNSKRVLTKAENFLKTREI